jgi:hypothetical protein
MPIPKENHNDSKSMHHIDPTLSLLVVAYDARPHLGDLGTLDYHRRHLGQTVESSPVSRGHHCTKIIHSTMNGSLVKLLQLAVAK